jgi:fatty-acyl-CoA synthase
VGAVAVVGVPDEILGEAVCACVVRVEGGVVTEEELRAWSAATLAGYRAPDLVSFMDELPLTDTGAVRRRELARRVAAALPGASAEYRRETNEE